MMGVTDQRSGCDYIKALVSLIWVNRLHEDLGQSLGIEIESSDNVNTR